MLIDSPWGCWNIDEFIIERLFAELYFTFSSLHYEWTSSRTQANMHWIKDDPTQIKRLLFNVLSSCNIKRKLFSDIMRLTTSSKQTGKLSRIKFKVLKDLRLKVPSIQCRYRLNDGEERAGDLFTNKTNKTIHVLCSNKSSELSISNVFLHLCI